MKSAQKKDQKNQKRKRIPIDGIFKKKYKNPIIRNFLKK